MSTVIGNLRVVLGLDSGAFQKGLNQATAGLRSVGRNMADIGRSMSIGITAPITAFGGLSLKAAGDFEAAMNRVQAATGASADEIRALEDIALKMGETTQFKASQAAEAIEMLAKNGLDASQILGGALEASMLLAASSGSDLASSGDLATDVMLQFGKQAGELTGLVDGMTGVMLASKFGFDDYRLAVAQAGGVAGGLGETFEDFNAAIAGTSSLFASGSDAGTSFKTFLQRLVPASAPAATAMKDLNLEFFEADGSMKAMADVAQELQDGLAGLSDEARNDALSTIFGTDALRTAIGLAEQGADGIDRLKVSIGEASATEQAEARLQGFNGEMLKLKSAVEALMIAIGNSGILEWATKLTQQVTALVLQLKDSNPEMLKWGVILAGVAAALGPVLAGIGMMLMGIGPLLGGMASLAGIVKAVAIAIAALGAPFAAAATVIGGAAFLAWQNWETVGPWFKELFRALGNIFEGTANVIVALITGDLSLAAAGLRQAWEGLDTFFTTLLDGIAAAFEAAWERIKPVVENLGNASSAVNRGLNQVTGANKGPIAPGPYTGPATGPMLPGSSIPMGMEGVVEEMGALGDAAGGAFEGRFNERMGIQSPSRVMQEAGQYIMQGLGNGILQQQPQVIARTEDLGETIESSITSHLDGIIRGTTSVKEAFASMLQDIASQMMSSGVAGLMGGLFGPVRGFDALSMALRAIPGFAAGGMHGGGYRIVGERGPELEATGPARYFSASQTAAMVGGGGGRMQLEIVPSEMFEVRMVEVADGAASRMGVQVSKSMPAHIQQYQATRGRKRY